MKDRHAAAGLGGEFKCPAPPIEVQLVPCDVCVHWGMYCDCGIDDILASIERIGIEYIGNHREKKIEMVAEKNKRILLLRHQTAAPRLR